MGTSELIIVAIVVLLLVLGPTKIPQLGDALGKGIRNFKKATRSDDSIDVTPKGPGQISQGAPTGQANAPAQETVKKS